MIEPQAIDIASALKVKCDTVCHSYGIWNEVLPNLTSIEQITLQKANRFFYDIAMSRSQTKISLPSYFFFTCPDIGCLRK